MSIREKYVTVHEAATILGVCSNTLRTWGASEKIPEYRHPVNNYRMYKRADLQELIQRLEQSKSGPSRRQKRIRKSK